MLESLVFLNLRESRGIQGSSGNSSFLVVGASPFVELTSFYVNLVVEFVGWLEFC